MQTKKSHDFLFSGIKNRFLWVLHELEKCIKTGMATEQQGAVWPLLPLTSLLSQVQKGPLLLHTAYSHLPDSEWNNSITELAQADLRV